MKKVNIQAAKTHLSRLVEEVLAGEVVIIGKAGKPLVVLSPYAAPARNRVGGQLRNKIRESRDCWAGDELAVEDAAPLYPVRSPRPARMAEGRPR
jgi:prevent-host-death family protein